MRLVISLALVVVLVIAATAQTIVGIANIARSNGLDEHTTKSLQLIGLTILTVAVWFVWSRLPKRLKKATELDGFFEAIEPYFTPTVIILFGLWFAQVGSPFNPGWLALGLKELSLKLFYLVLGISWVAQGLYQIARVSTRGDIKRTMLLHEKGRKHQ